MFSSDYKLVLRSGLWNVSSKKFLLNALFSFFLISRYESNEQILGVAFELRQTLSEYMTGWFWTLNLTFLSPTYTFITSKCTFSSLDSTYFRFVHFLFLNYISSNCFMNTRNFSPFITFTCIKFFDNKAGGFTKLRFSKY